MDLVYAKVKVARVNRWWVWVGPTLEAIKASVARPSRPQFDPDTIVEISAEEAAMAENYVIAETFSVIAEKAGILATPVGELKEPDA